MPTPSDIGTLLAKRRACTSRAGADTEFRPYKSNRVVLAGWAVLAPFSKIQTKMKVRRLLELSPRIRVAIGIALLLLVLVLIYPFKTTIVPAWPLRVLNESRVPVRGVNVTEHWQYALLEDAAQEETQKTDGDGRVSFPSRSIRANLLQRAWARLTRKKEGTGTRPVPPASIVVWGSKDVETTVATYDADEAPHPELVVRTK